MVSINKFNQINIKKAKKNKVFCVIGNDTFLTNEAIRHIKKIHGFPPELSEKILLPISESEAIQLLSHDFFAVLNILDISKVKGKKLKLLKHLMLKKTPVILIPISNTTTKFVEKLTKTFITINCKQINRYGNELPAYIKKRATIYNVILSHEMVAYIIKAVSNNLQRIERILINLRHLNKKLSLLDVVRTVGSDTAIVYEVVDKIICKNSNEIFNGYIKMVENNVYPLILLNLLSEKFVKIYKIKNEGISDPNMSIHYLHPKEKKFLIYRSRYWEVSEVKSILRSLYYAYVDIKQLNKNPWYALSKIIINIVENC